MSAPEKNGQIRVRADELRRLRWWLRLRDHEPFAPEPTTVGVRRWGRHYEAFWHRHTGPLVLLTLILPAFLVYWGWRIGTPVLFYVLGPALTLVGLGAYVVYYQDPRAGRRRARAAARSAALETRQSDDPHGLDLADTETDDARLRSELERRQNVESLSLSGTEVTDAGLLAVARLTRLRVLELAGTDVTDAGAARLESLSRLEVLDVSSTLVSDFALYSLRKLPKLREVVAEETAVTALGIAVLGGFMSLRETRRPARAPSGGAGSPEGVLTIVPFVWKGSPFLRALLANVSRHTYGLLVLTTHRLAYVPVGERGLRTERAGPAFRKRITSLAWQSTGDPALALLERSTIDVPLEDIAAVRSAGYKSSTLEIRPERLRRTRFSHVEARGGSPFWPVASTASLAELVRLAAAEREWELGRGPRAFWTEDMMPLLLLACPSFSETWQAHLEEWDGAPPLGLSLGEYANHLVELAELDETGEFPAVFEVVERLRTQGETEVRTEAFTGLLDDLKAASSREGVDADVFVRHLGPESDKAWQFL
jgi:hypothetical protein